MAQKHLLTSCSGFVLACLLAFTVQVYLFSPISPVLLELPPPSSSSSFPQNNILQRVIKLGDGILLKPEDIALDKEGTLYTATRDGWIKRLHRNGTLEDWKMLNSHALLGITITSEGDLVACDVGQGLLKVTESGVTVLASHVNGSRIRIPDMHMVPCTRRELCSHAKANNKRLKKEGQEHVDQNAMAADTLLPHLPDLIVEKIFRLIPTKLAVRSSIVSKQ